MDINQIHQRNVRNEFSKFALAQILQNDPSAYQRYKEILKPEAAGGDRDLFQFPIKEGA